MSMYKNWKFVVLLVGLAVQKILISSLFQTEIGQWYSQLIDGGCNHGVLQVARELPEPGSILVLAFGSLWIRKRNHKERKQLRS